MPTAALVSTVEGVQLMPPMKDDDVVSHRLKILEERLKDVGSRTHDLADELSGTIARFESDHAELERHRADCARRDQEKRAGNWQMWMVIFACLVSSAGGWLKTSPVQPAPVVNVTVPKDSIKVILPTKVMPGGGA